jgi:hypothetical protein
VEGWGKSVHLHLMLCWNRCSWMVAVTKREKKRAPKVRQLPAQKHIKISVLQCRTHDWFACLVHWPKLRNVETLRMSILIVNMNKYHTGPIMAPSLVLPSNQGSWNGGTPSSHPCINGFSMKLTIRLLGYPISRNPLNTGYYKILRLP